ncbi:hypothetical protein OH77DRAFT_1423407, partial [Trametes cingulata]
MADEDGQDGPDLETLQAQIDMSMAFTHNIVSSWMKSSKAKLPSSSSRNDDRELEEYMRRPARLGVGASAPEATGVLSRETAKLRNKLTGKGKKREREDEDAALPGAANAKAGGAAADSDEDEEDSRARVITKKARVDPFAAKGDGKKKKKKGDPLAVPAPKSEAVRSTAVPAAVDEKEAEDGDVGEDAREEKPPEHNAPLPSSSKKKKKKKHKAGTDQDGPPGDAQPGAIAPRDGAVAGGNNIASSKPPTTLSASSKTAVDSDQQQSPHGADSGVGPHPSSAQSPRAASHKPAMSPTVSSTIRQDPFGIPLLNLSGPPPETGEQSPKKKRKRKKKKKKSAVQPAVGTAAIPEDEDEDGSDD